ncbi:MAG: hypothetical protein FIA95_09490, partial [Gemmatimonadetes bacterium]|nr:hypothetical protein [Gemmatimonadota bacterium]
MKVLAMLSLAALAACGARAPATLHTSWEPLLGLYAFEGRLAGRSPVSVSGTLTLESQGYYVSSTHGSCRERLDRPWVGPGVTVSCPGIRVSFRFSEGQVPEEGVATVTVQRISDRQECRTRPDGQQVCVTVEP